MDVSYSRVNNSDDNGSTGPRERWGSKAQFVLSCVGSTIGLAHFGSFPYFMFHYGGVAFFIPYIIMMVFMDIPFLLMVLSVGQYTRNGPVKAVEMMMFGQLEYYGIGFAIVLSVFVRSTYIIIIVAWMLLYFVASFNSEQSFNSCNNIWNTEYCYTLADYNSSRSFYSVLSTEEYFVKKFHHGSYWNEDFGSIQWELFGFFALAWFLVYICLHKGITSYGKVVYVTGTIPYLVLTILAVVGASLEGSGEGISILFKPTWKYLLQLRTWVYAGYQNFFSSALTAGSMITFSSYNDFHSRTLVRDTLIISFMNLFTRLIGSCVVALFFGHFAHIMKLNIYNFFSYSMVYGILPAVLSTMSVPQFWCVLYFIMAICLMINIQLSLVQVVITTIMDRFPKLKPLYCNRKEILVLYICLFTFACGIPCTFQGGAHYMDTMNYYSYYAFFPVAFAIVATISFLYGTSRLLKNFEEMTSFPPNIYFVACWYIITPIFLLFICVFGFLHGIELQEYYDGDLQYVGWSIVFLSVIWIPVGFVLMWTRSGHQAQNHSTPPQRVLESDRVTCEVYNMWTTSGHQTQDHSTPPQRVLESDRVTCEAELTDTIETTV